MPKRIIDGEGLWHSHKLAQVSPSWMKAEYANLVPLALANGVFEYEPELIWATVYAYNRPEITITMVAQIFAEFERVGLVSHWSANGKTWGFWNGINKSGRLPPPSRQKYRPTSVGPYPPDYIIDSNGKPADSQQVAEGYAGIGIGIGSGIGFGASSVPLQPVASQRIHARENPTTKIQNHNPEYLNAAKWVCQELSLAGKSLWIIHDVIRDQVEHSTDSPSAVAEMLVRCRRSYEAAPHRDFVYDARAFFERGIWKQSHFYESRNNGSYHDPVLIDSRSYEPDESEPPHVYCANPECHKDLGAGDPTQQFVCSAECATKANLEVEVFPE